MSRTISDVDQINQLYSESPCPILGNFPLLAHCRCCSPLSLQVALICLFVIPLLWWLTHHFRSNQRRCFTLLRAIISALNGFVQERLLGFSTIMFSARKKREKANLRNQ